MDKRENYTTLFGNPFSFTPGVKDGERTKASILRVSQEWMQRSMSRVLVINSRFSFGLDTMDATILDNYEMDGDFTAWLFQAQLLERIKPLNSVILLGVNLQLTDDSLLPMEKFAIGGALSIRGYRENQITTDNGLTGSLEWRIPTFKLKVWRLSKATGDGLIHLCSFFDYGNGWNSDNSKVDPHIMYSAGLGLRWTINDKINMVIYKGFPLRKAPEPSSHDMQDDGLHFQFNARIF